MPAAVELAPLLVRYGAAATITGALMTLVQRDLRGLYRGTTAMHGGMLLAALGAASLGNFAAALLVAVAMGLALGGLGIMITSLEERVGPVGFRRAGRTRGGVPAARRGVRALRWRRRGPAGDGRLRRRRPAAAHAVDGEPGEHGHRDPVERAPRRGDADCVLQGVPRTTTVARWRPTSIARERLVVVTRCCCWC